MNDSPTTRPTLTRLAGDPGSGDLLVLGAGLGAGSATLWGPVARLLGDRYECLGLDLPGHGGAPADGVPFTVEELATRTCELVEELSVAPRTAWYAGVSIAGAVALALAVEPGPFRGVAVVAAASTLGSPDMWRERAALVRSSGTAVMVEGSLERWFAPDFHDRDPDTVERMMRELVETDDESYALCCEALARHDLRAALGRARVPSLVLPGAADVIVDLDRVRADAAALSGSTLHILEGVGHEPPVEAPAQVAQQLSDFFDRVRGAGSS